MMRTPKNYDGIQTPSKKIEDLLPQILQGISLKTKGGGEEIFQCWKDLLGEKMAPMTECISWTDEVLTVKVKSATLYSLLRLHEKARLLKRLQEQFPVRDIVFRVG